MESKTLIPVVVLLVVSSFLVGSLWTKINYLGKESKTETRVVPSPQKESQEKEVEQSQPKVLGASEMDNLVKGGVVLGESDAKVVVVEFSDPSCPFCAAAAGADIVIGKDESGQETHIISDYLKARDPSWEAPGPKLETLAREGKIQLVFRYYPGHGAGEKAMQAAFCAQEQSEDKFWGFLNLSFANQTKIEDIQQIVDLAGKIGLDGAEIKSCVESNKYQERIQADIQAGREAAKAATGQEGFGTPTFFVNGQQIVGAQPYAVFEKIIEEELNK